MLSSAVVSCAAAAPLSCCHAFAARVRRKRRTESLALATY